MLVHRLSLAPWLVFALACTEPPSTVTPVAPTVTTTAAPSVKPAAMKQVQRPLVAESTSACVLDAKGVACWGENGEGLFTKGMRDGVATPLRVEGIPAGASVALRAVGPDAPSHGYVLLPSGRIHMFAAEGTREDVPDLADVVDFTVGLFVLCAATSDGTLKCRETMGKKGALPAPALTQVSAVGSAIGTYCAVHGGAVTCWGYAAKSDHLELEKERRIGKVEDATAISVGRELGCVVRASGTVTCFSTMAQNDAARDVRLPEPAASVAVGASKACAALRSGKVACWGTPSDPTRSLIGVPVEGLEGAEHVAVGSKFACARSKEGTVSCWGSASRGALGDGTKSEITKPLQVGAVSKAQSLALGRDGTCVLDAAGKPTCWGFGDEPDKPNRAPFVVAGIEKARAAMAGDDEMCFVTAASELSCFRTRLTPDLKKPTPLKDVATLGIGDHLVPVTMKSGEVRLGRRIINNKGPTLETKPIKGLKKALDVAASNGDFCIVEKKGTVQCVAHGYWGDLEKTTPKVYDVPGLTDIIAIGRSARTGYCAVRKTGTVACFDPRFPRANEESEPLVITPKDVAGLTDVATITKGNADAICVTTKKKEVACWGWNSGGQLGSGDFADSEKPRLIPGLSDVEQVATGREHTCALRTDGAVLCWGSNAHGQVNGSPGYREKPVAIKLP